MNIFASLLFSLGLIICPALVFAENDPSAKYRVLSTDKSVLNTSTINKYLDQAKVSINTGNLDNAVEKLKKARTVSKSLIDYYRDLNSSFKGIDALIPRELTKKKSGCCSTFS